MGCYNDNKKINHIKRHNKKSGIDNYKNPGKLV